MLSTRISAGVAVPRRLIPLTVAAAALFGARIGRELSDLARAAERLGRGDLLLFFTDGISEAMNAESDCFGESRLERLVEEHGHLAPEELRERILREIQAFVGDAPQHDDMTMILLKMDHAEGGREADRPDRTAP